jgi:hypothetical protein
VLVGAKKDRLFALLSTILHAFSVFKFSALAQKQYS